MPVKHLVVVVGPTAVGKTGLSIELAKKLKCEIISCDSRQFYKELSIGTAKPTLQEMDGVKHHFIDSHSIQEQYDVGQFEKDVLELLNNHDNDTMIMVGGSGLFVNAVLYGLDQFPETSPETRKKLNDQYEKQGLVPLLEELEKLDPEYFEEVDKANPQRVLRALEVCRESGKPYSSFRTKEKKERSFNYTIIGLEMEREALYERINQRMDLMLSQGLEAEAKAVEAYKHLNALQTVGYSEVYGFLEGRYDKEEMTRLLKRNSRRYAKRQMTWFRRNEEIKWFHPQDKEEILAYIVHE